VCAEEVKVRLLDQIGSSYNNSIICCAASWLRATEVSHVYISTRAEKKMLETPNRK
jgi:hypothetical protein